MNSSEFITKAKDICDKKTMYIQTALGTPLTKANKLRLASASPFNSQRSAKIFEASEDTLGFDEIGLVSYISGVKFKDFGQLMSQCSDISKDFLEIVPGEIVFMQDRAGIFIGDGQVVTVSLDGVGITTVDGWKSHGKFAFVTYDEPTPEVIEALTKPTPIPEEIIEAEPDDVVAVEEVTVDAEPKQERRMDVRHDSRRRGH